MYKGSFFNQLCIGMECVRVCVRVYNFRVLVLIVVYINDVLESYVQNANLFFCLFVFCYFFLWFFSSLQWLPFIRLKGGFVWSVSILDGIGKCMSAVDDNSEEHERTFHFLCVMLKMLSVALKRSPQNIEYFRKEIQVCFCYCACMRVCVCMSAVDDNSEEHERTFHFLCVMLKMRSVALKRSPQSIEYFRKEIRVIECYVRAYVRVNECGGWMLSVALKRRRYRQRSVSGVCACNSKCIAFFSHEKVSAPLPLLLVGLL